ncbi:MAG: DUF86 domain-containing protein [Prevotella sp.]|nr:DUF86 domain-containing protein [Prevotella sp.]
MRERARDKGRIQDIIEHSSNVEELMQGLTYDDFLNDKRTYYAVMKNIEIVGEAAFMLTKAYKESHPQTPWKIVMGMRHVLVHVYANVVSTTLYDTAKSDIPMLRQQAEKYLSDTNWDDWENSKDFFDEVEDAVYRKTIDTAKKMKAKGFSTTDIAEVTGLNIADIEKL